MRLALALALMAPLAATAALAAPQIVTGKRIPTGFAARDTAGKVRDFASISGNKGSVMVFFRSAKWCPYCQAQLKELQALNAPLAAKGYKLTAISYDTPAVLAEFGKRQGLGYTLLSDSGSKMIDAFGLRDPAYDKGSFAYGVPKATVLVVGRDGTVKQMFVTADYKVRPNNATILAAAQ